MQLEKIGVKVCGTNSPEAPKVSEEGGAGGAPGAHGADHGEAAVPLQPMEVRVEQRSTCSLWRTPHWSRWMSEGGCYPMES